MPTKSPAPQPVPLSSARQQLATALTALAAADKAAQAAAAPIANLHTLIAGKRQQLAALQQQGQSELAVYAAQVEAWATSGGTGPMPAADGHIAASQADRNAIEALSLEIQGLEAAIAKLEPVRAAAVARLAPISASVRGVIKQVLLEHAVTAGQNRQTAIAAYQRHTAELAAIRGWLLQQPDSGMEAETIRRSIDAFVADPTVAQINAQVARWHAFAEALVTNPGANPTEE